MGEDKKKEPSVRTWMTWMKDLQKEEREDDKEKDKALLDLLKVQQEQAAKERARWQMIALVIILGGLAAAGVKGTMSYGPMVLDFMGKDNGSEDETDGPHPAGAGGGDEQAQ